jgi:hypothetical protein
LVFHPLVFSFGFSTFCLEMLESSDSTIKYVDCLDERDDQTGNVDNPVQAIRTDLGYIEPESLGQPLSASESPIKWIETQKDDATSVKNRSLSPTKLCDEVIDTTQEVMGPEGQVCYNQEVLDQVLTRYLIF